MTPTIDSTPTPPPLPETGAYHREDCGNSKLRKERISIIIITVLSLLSVLGCLSSCFISVFVPENPLKLGSSYSRVKLPKDTTVLTNIDTGRGLPFPGGASDGYTYFVFQLPHEKITSFSATLEKSPYWNPLPLSTELRDHENSIQKVIADYSDQTFPFDISNGYYLFVDDQTETSKLYGFDDSDLATPFYDRSSYNFTFCLFNVDDGKLYVWDIDT
jgi:hypothetical protein